MTQLFQCRSCKATYAAVQDDGTAYFHVCAPITKDEGLTWEFPPDGRDETVQVNRYGQEIGLVAEGKGVSPVGKTALPEPKWITEMKARIAKRGD